MSTLIQHFIRIAFIFSLFLVEKKYTPIGDDSLLLQSFKLFVFSALLYFMGRLLLIKSFKASPKWQHTLCFTPAIIVILSYNATPWISTLALMISLPSCLIAYYFYKDRLAFLNLPTLAKIGIITFLWVNFITFLHQCLPYYDVWQLYDLSQHLLHSFSYETNYIRAVQYNTTYGYSFPFLYPVLLAIVDATTEFGINSFVILNYAASACIVLIIRQICISLRQGEKWGIISWLIFVIFKMPSEVNGGGTTPFTLLALSLLVLLLAWQETQKCFQCDKYISAKVAILFSTILGFGCAVRFDFLPISLIALFCWSVYFLYLRRNFKMVAYALGTFVFFLLPWMIYSYVQFDHFYIMDNSRRLLYIPDTKISSFYKDISEVQTLFTHPLEWIQVKGNRIVEMAIEFSKYLLITPSVIIISLIAIYQIIKNKSAKLPRVFTRSALVLCVVTSCYVPILFLTGYLGCERYYIPFFSIVIIIGSLHVSLKNFKLPVSTMTKRCFYAGICAIPLIVAALFCVNVLPTTLLPKRISSLYTSLRDQQPHSSNPLQLTEHEVAVRDYINKEKENNPRLLAHRTPFQPFYLPRFSASADIVCIPNLEQVENTTALIKFFNVDFMYSDHVDYINTIKKTAQPENIIITDTGITNLYKIKILE